MSLIDKIAWLRIEDGRILVARSRGKDTYYLPGGKREPDETDVEVLVREIREELTVAITPESATFFGAFEAPAHGHRPDVIVRVTCYTADYEGELKADSEIDELAWLTYADRGKLSDAGKVVFVALKERGLLA